MLDKFLLKKAPEVFAKQRIANKVKKEIERSRLSVDNQVDYFSLSHSWSYINEAHVSHTLT
jgi:spore coat polysaccharide biosynthesis protein SpsF (cytidylyltransferase family)